MHELILPWSETARPSRESRGKPALTKTGMRPLEEYLDFLEEFAGDNGDLKQCRIFQRRFSLEPNLVLSSNDKLW